MKFHEAKVYHDIPKVHGKWREDLAGKYPDTFSSRPGRNAREYFLVTARDSITRHTFFGKITIDIPFSLKLF